MRRHANQHDGSDLLTTVRDGFARWRAQRRGSRDRFPDEVRRLALAAVEAGHPRGQVATAAGIERGALARWQREAQSTRPSGARELRIVKHRDEAPAVSTASGVAVVRLGPGVAIEVPLAALTDSLVRMLVAAGSGGGW
jgi:hypothetical protein